MGSWELRRLFGLAAIIAVCVLGAAVGIAAAIGEFNRTAVSNLAVGGAVILLGLAALFSGLLRFNLHPMDPMYTTNLTTEYMLAQQEYQSGRAGRSFLERLGPSLAMVVAAFFLFVVVAFLG